MRTNRLLVKITKELLPQIKDRYPFLYLERGRLEVDDSSVRWIDSNGQVIPLPIATIQALLLGPGTSVTHEAIKVLSMVNCLVAWVGEDCLLYYASGQSPTHNSRNLIHQIDLATNPIKRLQIARKMFSYRFPADVVDGKSLTELMGMEGIRVRKLYAELAEKYQIFWKGRRYTPGEFKIGDITNRCITACNAALYGIVCACIHSMGLSPRIGFIHSGSPLPFVYDIADLYKSEFSIELSFSLTKQLGGVYIAENVRTAFVEKALKENLLQKIPSDICNLLDIRNDYRNNQ